MFTSLPILIRFLILNALIGVAIGWGLVAGLLWLDAGGLGTLVLRSDSPILAVAVLGVFFSITFGSVAMGTAVMTQLRDDKPGGGKRSRIARSRREAGPAVPARQSAQP